MNNWFNHRQLLAVLLSIICSVPAIATAIPTIATTEGKLNSVEGNTVTVSFADLNLSKQAGAETLYGRLKTGARQACGGSQDFRNIGIRRLTRQCYNEALSGAVQSINNETLTNLHANAR
jgi:UrcA family protein